MPDTPFTLSDLMSLLTEKAGLPATSHTTDPDAHFADIGLDSLAFLSMQTELQEVKRAGKDWRRTIGMFTDDEGMKAIFQEALKLREADRKKTRSRAPGKGRKPKR